MINWTVSFKCKTNITNWLQYHNLVHFVHVNVCDSPTSLIINLHADTHIFICRNNRTLNKLLVAEQPNTNPVTGQDPQIHPTKSPPKCRWRKTLVAYLVQPIRAHNPHHYSLFYLTCTVIQLQCPSLRNTTNFSTSFIIRSAHTFSWGSFLLKFVTCVMLRSCKPRLIIILEVNKIFFFNF